MLGLFSSSIASELCSGEATVPMARCMAELALRRARNVVDELYGSHPCKLSPKHHLPMGQCLQEAMAEVGEIIAYGLNMTKPNLFDHAKTRYIIMHSYTTSICMLKMHCCRMPQAFVAPRKALQAMQWNQILCHPDSFALTPRHLALALLSEHGVNGYRKNSGVGTLLHQLCISFTAQNLGIFHLV